MNVALIGKTGSGKSTLAKFLADLFGLTIINSDIQRDYIRDKQDGWEKVRDAIAVGAYVQGGLIEKIWRYKLDKAESQNYVIDHLPSVEALRVFESYHKLDKVFLLDVSDKIADKRVIERAREENVLTQLASRKEIFAEKFPKLQLILGDRIIVIDAEKDTTSIRDDVMKELSVFSRERGEKQSQKN